MPRLLTLLVLLFLAPAAAALMFTVYLALALAGHRPTRGPRGRGAGLSRRQRREFDRTLLATEARLLGAA